MTRLTILHTNDIHGRLSQLTRIAALVKQIKAEVAKEGGYCLYLDGGDSEDTVLLESSLTKGAFMGTVLRAAGCDMMALGNSIPLRYGTEVLAVEAGNFGKDILCANLANGDGSRIDGLVPCRLMQLGKVKLAVTGLTAPLAGYATIFNLKISLPVEVMPGLLGELRAQGPRLVIALNHIASVEDIKLAEAVPGIDLIIGGHDHKVLHPPLQVNGCLIAQAGEHGKFLGRIDLDIDDTDMKIVSHTSAMIPITEDLPEDAETVAAIRMEGERTAQMMSHVVGRVDFPIDLAVERECTAGNLLADALLTRFDDAQFAFTLAGHWQTGLSAGEITAGQLFAASRSSANPARVELTGAQVRRFLAKALLPENAGRSDMHQMRNTPVGWPHVSGLELAWDGRDVESLEVFYQGKPLMENQTYIVAASDMEFSDFIGYLPLDDAQVSYEVPTIMPEVLQDYLAQHSPLTSIQQPRIKIK